ncbi:DUF6035 family protein [Martelella sp. AMO21009]
MDKVSARQFSGAQESPLHIRIKNIVGELLNADARTEPGSVIIDEYLVTESGRRRPDVRVVYDDAPLVVEVQLATTQIPIIVQREDFYTDEAHRLLWLTWNFEPPPPGDRLPSSFEDIFYSHNKNLFAMDDETISLSRQESDVCLRAFWVRDHVWQSKLVRLSELQWLPSGRAFAMAPPLSWHEDFLMRWRAATGNHALQWPERGMLLSELIENLTLENVDGRALEDLGVDALISCLLSLLDGHPVGSQQKNLVEVLNTFLYASRRHRYARLVRRFAELTGQTVVLKTPSVQAKLAAALATPQDDPQSLTGRIALGLFPQVFQARKSR